MIRNDSKEQDLARQVAKSQAEGEGKVWRHMTWAEQVRRKEPIVDALRKFNK